MMGNYDQFAQFYMLSVGWPNEQIDISFLPKFNRRLDTKAESIQSVR